MTTCTGTLRWRFALVLTAAAAWPAAGRPALAGSVWEKAVGGGRPVHSDDTARRIGDSLTIVIDERSVIENETSRDMSKKSSRKASVAGNVDLLRGIDRMTGKLFNVPDMNLNMTAENDFQGEADYDSDRKVSDQITVTVADVLPNGNLLIVGSREREVAGDAQIVQVSGVVRPSDIAFDNSVRSDKVAEFRIVLTTKGRENRFTKPGWLDRILNFLNPF